MKKILSVAASLALFAASAVHAQDVLSVEGTGATGTPGDRVFVTLSYDYGAGLEAVVEDFRFTYDSSVLSFLFPASTVVRGGLSQSLEAHIDDLDDVADEASAKFNLLPDPGSPPDAGNFRLAYSQPDFFGAPGDFRQGSVIFNLAFEIADAAPAGNTFVSLAGSKLTTFDANFFVATEYSYPAALRSVQVTVQAVSAVPEPAMALMLLPGLALIGMQVRRRRARQNANA